MEIRTILKTVIIGAVVVYLFVLIASEQTFFKNPGQWTETKFSKRLPFPSNNFPHKGIAEVNHLQLTEHIIKDLIFIKKDVANILRTPWKNKLEMRLTQMTDKIDNILHRMGVATNWTEEQKFDQEKIKEDVEYEVCPEMYRGYEHGIPLFHNNWEVQKCKTSRKFEDLVSITMNLVNVSEDKVKEILIRVLKGINATHSGLRVTVAVSFDLRDDKVTQAADGLEFTVMRVSEEKPGKIWNRLMSNVTTKYVLIANNMTHFYGFDARLMRLVREVQGDLMQFVGGAVRNSSGHWSMSCQQTTLKYNEMRLKSGYDFSKHECVFCDAITGPFLSQTRNLGSNPFDEDLPSEMIFYDFFIRQQANEAVSAVCPDSMFFVDTNEVSNESWRHLASKYNITELHLPSGESLKYSCSDVGVQCDLPKSIAKPKCCLKLLADELHTITQMYEENNVLYRVDCGTVIGAVKFSSILPWEIDADVLYYRKDFDTVMKAFDKRNYSVTVYENGR